MRSATSFFDWTVFKKTILRFWPLWGAYFAVWLVVMPLNGLMMLRLDSYNVNDFGYMEEFAFAHVPQMATNGWWVLPLVFGALCAMAVFSHLYNARSANLFGSLPIRREGLFITHYLAGLAFFAAPNLVVFLLTALVELAGGAVCWQGLGFWLVVMCGEGFFFYSLAVLCAMFTGHILALPVFYAIANCLVAGVVGLVELVLREFYYGYSGLTEGVYDVVQWFTPVLGLDARLRCFSYLQGEQPYPADAPETMGRVLEFQGLGTVGVYAIAAVVLVVCAFLLYRVRRLESAGDVVAVGPMKPVFKYGVAVCAGLALGFATTIFIGGGEIGLMAAIVVWGVIGYFAAEMLLQKSFRVFKKWKGAVAVAAVFLALFCVVGFDLTGFETRVPDPDQVDSVEFSGINAVYLGDDGDDIWQDIKDPELIRLAVILHKEAAAQRDEERRLQLQEEGVSTSLNLTYHLKGGGTLSRQYSLYLDPDEVDTEGAAAWAVQQFYNNRELYWKVYGFQRLEDEDCRLERVERESYDEETGAYEEAAFYGRDAAVLFSAVKEDFFAGRIGARRLDDGDHLYGAPEEDRLILQALGPEDSDGHRNELYVAITLQDSASSTLAALEGLADRAVRPGDTEIRQ